MSTQYRGGSGGIYEGPGTTYQPPGLPPIVVDVSDELLVALSETAEVIVTFDAIDVTDELLVRLDESSEIFFAFDSKDVSDELLVALSESSENLLILAVVDELLPLLTESPEIIVVFGVTDELLPMLTEVSTLSQVDSAITLYYRRFINDAS